MYFQDSKIAGFCYLPNELLAKYVYKNISLTIFMILECILWHRQIYGQQIVKFLRIFLTLPWFPKFYKWN